MIIQIVVIEKPKMRIDLVDKIDDEVEKGK